MNKTLKVLLTCLISSGIGTFIALSVNSWFWWTGALAGGVIGYLSYEFKKVIQAIPKAWRSVSSWKPDREYWIGVPLFFLFLSSIAFSFSVFVGFLMFLGSYDLQVLLWIFYGHDVWHFAILGFLVIALVASFIVVGEHNLTNREVALNAICFSPPCLALELLILIVYILGVIGLGSWKNKHKIPIAIKTLGRFFRKLFLLIHSEIRLLCAVDSMFGVIAGYLISQAYSLNFLMSVLTGMIAGAVFGLLHYQILSVKILKLAPRNGEE